MSAGAAVAAWFARVRVAPCIDDLVFSGPLGTCTDIERAGLCFDGGYHANATQAAAHCCACGRDNQREACFIRDWANAEWIAAHKLSMEPHIRRAEVLRTVRADPSAHGYDILTFRRWVDRIALQSQRYIFAWTVALERLSLLALCVRVCDAALLAVDEYQDSLAVIVNTATRDLTERVLDAPADLARRVCKNEISFEIFFEVVVSWCLRVIFVMTYNQAQILNAYFRLNPDAGGGGFVAHPGFLGVSRRWKVLERLLEWRNCRHQRCDIVEIGVFAAQTSLHVLKQFPLLHLHGVDPYLAFPDQPNADEEVYRVAKTLYADYASRATLYRNMSSAVAPTLGPPLQPMLDLVFIDGSHLFENVLDDITVWAPKAQVIAGHDLSIADTAVARAILAWDKTRTIHILPDGIWCIDVLKNT